MKLIKYFIFFIIVLTILPFISFAQDAQTITDWYIRDFHSAISVQTDSSLYIEEKITADCGNLPDKHGIFRVLPTQIKTDREVIDTPISLIGITDFEGDPVKYSIKNDYFDHTVTYKIGDPDKTVTGVNYYKITYVVKNAIRAGNQNFDELYLNLSGNFWDIAIDKFTAAISFPQGIDKNNIQLDYYTGTLNSKNKNQAVFSWPADNTIEFVSTSTLLPRQGITASITFPKGIVTPYIPSFLEIYGPYFWLIIPLLSFIIAFKVWSKYGKDPVVDKTIIPEFEIPQNLTPMEMGLLHSNGNFSDALITSTIIDLAVKKYLVIEEIKKSWLLGQNDFKLKLLKPAREIDTLNLPEKNLINQIFKNTPEVRLSDLKKDFYTKITDIKKSALENLKQKGLISPRGLTLRIVLIIIASIIFSGMFIVISLESIWPIISLVAAGTIFMAFGILMPKRTPKGADLNWRIHGFKLYMKTAEKYRQQFNEKENIFEKFLPYAMVFGMAKLWIKKIEEIYGPQYFQTYHPAWYIGSFGTNFNAGSFESQLNSISSNIASNIGTSSGASGSGGAGGGSGGGGGGGW